MAKKKDRIINHIDQLNIEIDYDKLADAIVKANEKQSKQYSMSREWMKFLIYPVFWGVAIIAGILAIICLIYASKEMLIFLNATSVYDLDLWKLAGSVVSFVVSLFLIAVCMSTAFTAKEIDNETDRNYVATMFSNIVALVALVVSLIALVKG